MTLAQAYQDLVDVARPSPHEGLKQERATLLLWFIRNVFGVDDLEAYDYICDGPDDHGIDGLFLEKGDDEEADVIVAMQSKFPEKAKNVGVNDLKECVAVAAGFKSDSAYDKYFDFKKIEPELAHLLKRYDVRSRLAAGTLKCRVVFVCAGKLTTQARHYAEAVNVDEGAGFLTCYDALDLAPVVKAFKTPQTVTGTISFPAPSRFSAQFPDGKIVFASVAAKDLVQWPGIDDRTLFDLNVRRELRKNPVRTQLDRAIRRTHDHARFLAFHNGLTVVCEKVDDSNPTTLTVKNLSIVNGAQSTVAFRAGQAYLTDQLRVLVKFVEVDPNQQVAREVAVRSNTQNPVTNRNLRARDGVQLRLGLEFAEHFPNVTYETRPDFTNKASGRVIENDEAAQLLCAVYNEMPWLAVKRLALFDAETYPRLFHEGVHADQIVLCDLIADRVQRAKKKFPETYLNSWRLTKIVAVYLVGQLLRTDKQGEVILNDPGVAMKKLPVLEAHLDKLAKFAAATLVGREDARRQKQLDDDYKVDFKRESALKEMASEARKSYLTYVIVET